MGNNYCAKVFKNTLHNVIVSLKLQLKLVESIELFIVRLINDIKVKSIIAHRRTLVFRRSYLSNIHIG